MENDRSAVSIHLMELIYSGNTDEAVLILDGTADPDFWKRQLRYELPVARLIDDVSLPFRSEVLLPALDSDCQMHTISAFHYAAMCGSNEVLRKAVQFGLPSDTRLENGTTSLHLASLSGKLDTVKILVDELHADLKKADKYLWGPLHYASTSGQLSVVEFLLSRCPEAVNLRDKDGTTAAYRAKVNRHSVVEERLLSIANDADILLVNNDATEIESGGIDEPVYAKSSKFGKPPKSAINGNVTGGSQEQVYAQPVNIVRQGSARKAETPDANGVSQEPVYAQPGSIVRQGSARKPENPDANGGYSEIFANDGRKPYPLEEKYLEPKKIFDGIVKGNAQSDVEEMVRNMVKSQLGNLQRMMDTGVLNENQSEDPYETPRNVEDSSLSIDLATVRLILKQEFVEFVIDRNMAQVSPRIGDPATKTQVIRRNSSQGRKHQPLQEHPSTIYEEIISVLQTTLKKSKKIRTNGPALPDRKASFVKSKKDENDNEDTKLAFVRSNSRLKSNGSGIGEVLVLNDTSVISRKSSSDV